MDCAEFRRGNCSGKAPQGFCKHRLAANIYRRAVEMIAAQKEEKQVALPEAPASVNVRVVIAGREVQLTLRDTNEQTLLVRLGQLLAQFPVNAAQSGTNGETLCPIHRVPMAERNGK